MPEAKDYNGPFSKLVVGISRKFEIKTAALPRGARRHARFCALNVDQKFRLFVSDTIEPVTFVDAGFSAGISQASNDDSNFGQEAGGYGKRYGVSLLDNTSSNFFHTFFFPTIFRQDPRYYRLGYGTTQSRMGHALEHTVITRTDAGNRMFNFSEWLGTASADAIGTIYHPGARHGVREAVERDSVNIATDMGFDILREFWPEIARKFKLPFRPHDQPPAAAGGDPTHK